MSLDLRPVQVRLCDEAYNELAMIAAAEGKDLGEVARERLTRLLLGEGHAVRMAADRLARAVASGSQRQRASSRAKDRE
jgi:hypothetical protein